MAWPAGKNWIAVTVDEQAIPACARAAQVGKSNLKMGPGALYLFSHELAM